MLCGSRSRSASSSDLRGLPRTFPLCAVGRKIISVYILSSLALYLLNGLSAGAICENGNIEKIIEELVNGLSGCPACSPDGSKIAFATKRNGNWEIYIANSDGTNPYNFTNTPNEEEDSPAWSPDGRGIFFRKGEIYYQDLGSNIAEQITFDIGALDSAISSEGDRLLFVGQIGWYNLYVQELSNGNLIRLTFSETPSDPAYRYPAWKPKINN